MASMTEKPLMPKNVYIVGAHCTGKTTLLEALKQHFTQALTSEIFGPDANPPNFGDEIVRVVMLMAGFTADDVRDSVRGRKLQKLTLWSQYQMESAFHQLWIFSDRSGIDPIVYANFFLGSDASDELLQMPEWAFLRERMREGIVIVCEPNNVLWLSNDQARVALNDLEEWRAIGEAFKEFLREQEIGFVTIPVDMENLDARVQFVEGHIRSGI